MVCKICGTVRSIYDCECNGKALSMYKCQERMRRSLKTRTTEPQQEDDEEPQHEDDEEPDDEEDEEDAREPEMTTADRSQSNISHVFPG